MPFIKNSKELSYLSINDLILLYFKSLEESRNPHVMLDGANPMLAKKKYMYENRMQFEEISNILKSKGVPTNYFYLKFQQLKIKYFLN